MLSIKFLIKLQPTGLHFVRVYHNVGCATDREVAY